MQLLSFQYQHNFYSYLLFTIAIDYAQDTGTNKYKTYLPYKEALTDILGHKNFPDPEKTSLSNIVDYVGKELKTYEIYKDVYFHIKIEVVPDKMILSKEFNTPADELMSSFNKVFEMRISETDINGKTEVSGDKIKTGNIINDTDSENLSIKLALIASAKAIVALQNKLGEHILPDSKITDKEIINYFYEILDNKKLVSLQKAAGVEWQGDISDLAGVNTIPEIIETKQKLNNYDKLTKLIDEKIKAHETALKLENPHFMYGAILGVLKSLQSTYSKEAE